MSKVPFNDWSDEVDDGECLDLFPPWAPLHAVEFPGDIDDRHPDQDVINFEPDWSTVLLGNIRHPWLRGP